MKRRKLDKLKHELAQMRRSPQRAGDLESLATRLGRQPSGGGKHPVWESIPFPYLRPLAIPHHGGRDLAKGTRNSILAQLEDDVSEWDQRADDDDDDDDEGDVC